MEVAERAVSSLDLPARFNDFLVNEWGIEQLHPLKRRRFLDSQRRQHLGGHSHGIGKSLLAYMGMVKRISEGTLAQRPSTSYR